MGKNKAIGVDISEQMRAQSDTIANRWIGRRYHNLLLDAGMHNHYGVPDAAEPLTKLMPPANGRSTRSQLIARCQ